MKRTLDHVGERFGMTMFKCSACKWGARETTSKKTPLKPSSITRVEFKNHACENYQ